MLTSAIHYPSSRIHNEKSIKNALLLWDKYYVIGPDRYFRPCHDGVIGEAWSLIGDVLVPEERDRERTHSEILSFLENTSHLDKRFFYDQESTNRHDLYDIYPKKLHEGTWRALRDAGMTASLLHNSEIRMSSWGGLIIMSKLADVCAGDVFARVTDKPAAYRAIANEVDKKLLNPPANNIDQAHVMPVLLNMIDASSIPTEKLMRFRSEERDPTLRHNLLKSCSTHVDSLRKATSFNQIRAIQESYESSMKRDLEHLRDELKVSKIRFAISSSVLTAFTGAFAVAASLTSGPVQLGATLATAGTAGLGIKQMLDFYGAGLDLKQRQRDIMLKHPMAYMHSISQYSRR